MSVQKEIKEREEFVSSIVDALTSVEDFEKRASECLSVSKLALRKWSNGLQIPDRVFRVRILELISTMKRHSVYPKF